ARASARDSADANPPLPGGGLLAWAAHTDPRAWGPPAGKEARMRSAAPRSRGEALSVDIPTTQQPKERTMTIDKRDVTFKSGDSFAAGWFFLPEHAGSGTAV